METVKELESYFVRNLGYMIDALNDKEDMSVEEINEYKTAKRLMEICQAERDGRCVVLPVKLGTKVFRANGGEVEEWEMSYGIALNVRDDFGKTVFLTHEAAEAALKGGQ